MGSAPAPTGTRLLGSIPEYIFSLAPAQRTLYVNMLVAGQITFDATVSTTTVTPSAAADLSAPPPLTADLSAPPALTMKLLR